MRTATDRFGNYFSVRNQRPKCMRQSQILHVCFQSVKALCIWSWIPDTVAQNMAAAHANRGIFLHLETRTVKNFLKRSMEISLTLSKTVLLLLKNQYVRMSPNPVYNIPSTQRIATSQRHWNLSFLNNIHHTS